MRTVSWWLSCENADYELGKDDEADSGEHSRPQLD